MSLQPLEKLPRHPLKIKRALFSVSDKTNIAELGYFLHKQGIEILSTGGTAEVLKKEDIPVTDVSDVTGFPECLDGRVKTLHPNIHAGILARTSYPPDHNQLEELGITPIELIVVNLYPFKETIKKDQSLEVATEYIDIGGPTLIRAAAKNFAHVSVLTSPQQYGGFIQAYQKQRGIPFNERQKQAREAFNHTAGYDSTIANYFNRIQEQNEEAGDKSEPHTINEMPDTLEINLSKSQELRYGENPHQKAAVYGNQTDFIDCFHGKQLSYNNFLDVDSALQLMADFEHDDPTCAIFKHTVPCGVATDQQLSAAYRKAFATDTLSPFGGIVIVNERLDVDTAREIDRIFTEIIIAPEFADEALTVLKEKKNRRLVRYKKLTENKLSFAYRSIFGGALYQEKDNNNIDIHSFKVVSTRQPTSEEKENMIFAWKIVKHTKSNAIVYTRDRQTLGIGTGQTSRVESSQIAIAKAKEEGLDLKASAVASDAFFPFADGVEAAAKAGAACVIQPGGSIRDDEVIAKANEYNMAMIFTGQRHFRH